jgi:hypothetical protein
MCITSSRLSPPHTNGEYTAPKKRKLMSNESSWDDSAFESFLVEVHQRPLRVGNDRAEIHGFGSNIFGIIIGIFQQKHCALRVLRVPTCRHLQKSHRTLATVTFFKDTGSLPSCHSCIHPSWAQIMEISPISLFSESRQPDQSLRLVVGTVYLLWRTGCSELPLELLFTAA